MDNTTFWQNKESFHNTINIEDGIRLVVTQAQGTYCTNANVLLLNEHQHSIRLLAQYVEGCWHHPNQESQHWFWACAKDHSKSLTKMVKAAIDYDEVKSMQTTLNCFKRRLHIKYTKIVKKANKTIHNVFAIY